MCFKSMSCRLIRRLRTADGAIGICPIRSGSVPSQGKPEPDHNRNSRDFYTTTDAVSNQLGVNDVCSTTYGVPQVKPYIGSYNAVHLSASLPRESSKRV